MAPKPALGSAAVPRLVQSNNYLLALNYALNAAKCKICFCIPFSFVVWRYVSSDAFDVNLLAVPRLVQSNNYLLAFNYALFVAKMTISYALHLLFLPVSFMV